MKRYQVNIRPTAENDIETRYYQIAEDSPQNALNWYLHIIDSLLDSMAERCPVAPEDDDLKLGIRHLIIGNYRALFRIDGSNVDVLHIRHCAMERRLRAETEE